MTTVIDDEKIFEETEAINVMMLYEDGITGRLARQIYDELRVRLPEVAGTKLSLWKFETMGNPAGEHQAHLAARKADVMMVAAHGAKPIPAGVREVVDNWVRGKGAARISLIEVLEGVEKLEDSPVHNSLNPLAARANLEFVSYALPPAGQSRNPGCGVSLDNETFAPPVRRWGIND